MPCLVSLCRPFPWGILLVRDVSSEEVPPDFKSGALLTSTLTSVAIGVAHDADGSVTVEVWDSPRPGQSGFLLPEVTIKLFSGVMRVGDVLDDEFVDVPVVVGLYRIKVLVDDEVEPSKVDVLISLVES